MAKRDQQKGGHDALEAARREVKRRPRAAPPLFRLTRLLLERGDPEARAWLPRLDAFPDYAAGWSELGDTLLRLARPEAAQDCFERALASEHAPLTARLGAATCHLARNAPQQAIDYLEAAGGEAAADPRTLGLLGKARYAAGKPADAEPALLAALEANPNDAGSWYRLGLVRHDLGQYAEAAAAYQRALASDSDAIRREAAFNRGVALQASGQRDPAVEAYREAVRLDPDCTMRAIQALSSSASGLLWLNMAAARRFLGAD
jgi:tetratricopeptide (TPR) repeat protein